MFLARLECLAMGMIVTGWAGGYLLMRLSPSLLGTPSVKHTLFLQGAPIAEYILDASGGDDSGLKAYCPSIFYARGMAPVAALLAAGIRLKTEKRLIKRLRWLAVLNTKVAFEETRISPKVTSQQDRGRPRLSRTNYLYNSKISSFLSSFLLPPPHNLSCVVF